MPRESDRISVMSAQPQLKGYDGRRFAHPKVPGRNQPLSHIPRERVDLCDSPTAQSEEGGRKNRLQMNLRGRNATFAGISQGQTSHDAVAHEGKSADGGAAEFAITQQPGGRGDRYGLNP